MVLLTFQWKRMYNIPPSYMCVNLIVVGQTYWCTYGRVCRLKKKITCCTCLNRIPNLLREWVVLEKVGVYRGYIYDTCTLQYIDTCTLQISIHVHFNTCISISTMGMWKFCTYTRQVNKKNEHQSETLMPPDHNKVER